MITSKTPMRISFLGGLTDLPDFFNKHGGAVLGTAIHYYGYHRLQQLPVTSDYRLIISQAKKLEQVNSIDAIQHKLFKACLHHVSIKQRISIDYQMDLSQLSGMGSSSTFIVGLLQVLYRLGHHQLTTKELALEAIRVERSIMCKAVGCQDQIFAAYGGFNYIEFMSQDDFRVTPLAISSDRIYELERSLLLVNTGISRTSNTTISRIIGDLSMQHSILLKMKDLVNSGIDLILSEQDILAFGKLLHESWQLKCKLTSGMTNDVIGNIYKKSLDYGAVGGKLLGGGGGGFLLLVVPFNKQKKLIDNIPHIKKVRINAPGSIVY